MAYDFDKVISRKNTHSYKWDGVKRVFGQEDILPMWIADMDWPTPPFVKDAIARQIEETPVLGYTLDPEDWWETVIGWIRDHHQWEVSKEWITFVPGIVKAIGMVISKFVKEDEKVIVQPPVYHPFFLTTQGNKREVVWNPLIEVNDENGKLCSYKMDFEHLAKVCDDKCRLLILANPHNPCGITWDRETLKKLAHFAKERGLLVISDEIHCDLALSGHKHIPFASVSEEAAEISITFSAPTKTFNMAGVVSSWCIIPNKEIREPFFGWLSANELNEASMFAPVATVAALKEGEPWRQDLLKHVESNIQFVIDYCKENIPVLHPVRPQASYLIWLDCRALGLDNEALDKFFIEKARLGLNSGHMFGKEGSGFMRLNVACPRATLEQALGQLKAAVDSLSA